MPFAAPTVPIELKRVRVRLINTDERAQWDTMMRTHHYLGFVARLTALGHHSGMVMNQLAVPDKASEMKAVKPLLDTMELTRRVVTADALHTQIETAQYLVEEKGAHYLFTVNDNQPTFKADIASIHMDASPP